MIAPKFDFSRLSAPERLQLVEDLWDSLTPDQVPLSPSQAEELARREALHDAREWRQVLDEIEGKRA
jgi:putative addiction module component (TIGR02574 family)